MDKTRMSVIRYLLAEEGQVPPKEACDSCHHWDPWLYASSLTGGFWGLCMVEVHFRHYLHASDEPDSKTTKYTDSCPKYKRS